MHAEEKLRFIKHASDTKPLQQQHRQQRPDFQQLPASTLLTRLQSFLPGMAKANEQLRSQIEQHGSTAFSIEHDETDRSDDSEPDPSPYIELDLTCGLVDLQDTVALEAAEHAAARPAYCSLSEPASGSGSSSGSDSASSTLSQDAARPCPLEEASGASECTLPSGRDLLRGRGAAAKHVQPDNKAGGQRPAGVVQPRAQGRPKRPSIQML